MAHSVHEHVEHAGHEGGGAGRWLGITIAVLGVLLALCSAQLGAARTELISTMVEENSAKSQHTAVANKYRMLEAQLQQLHAAMPSPEFLEKKDHQLKDVLSKVKNQDTVHAMEFTQMETEKLLNTVIPTPDDVERFLALIDRTHEQVEAARHWSESYHDAVEAHKNSAKYFEFALLGAEIGIVIASVGLMLNKQVRMVQIAWGTAVMLGLASVAIAASTFIVNISMLHHAEERIEASAHHYTELNKEKEELAEDKKLEEDIRKDIPALKKFMAGS